MSEDVQKDLEEIYIALSELSKKIDKPKEDTQEKPRNKIGFKRQSETDD